jgi:hypothetical protein
MLILLLQLIIYYYYYSSSPKELVQLLFSLSTLHGGRVPFDLLAYAWQLAVQHGTAPR